MHKADTLAEKFQAVNVALDDFIQEVKAQGLWENTVIVMGSDFGRSMNTNSNSGTDHAWGKLAIDMYFSMHWSLSRLQLTYIV